MLRHGLFNINKGMTLKFTYRRYFLWFGHDQFGQYSIVFFFGIKKRKLIS